jgi:hypothetical protein
MSSSFQAEISRIAVMRGLPKETAAPQLQAHGESVIRRDINKPSRQMQVGVLPQPAEPGEVKVFEARMPIEPSDMGINAISENGPETFRADLKRALAYALITQGMQDGWLVIHFEGREAVLKLQIVAPEEMK